MALTGKQKTKFDTASLMRDGGSICPSQTATARSIPTDRLARLGVTERIKALTEPFTPGQMLA